MVGVLHEDLVLGLLGAHSRTLLGQLPKKAGNPNFRRAYIGERHGVQMLKRTTEQSMMRRILYKAPLRSFSSYNFGVPVFGAFS